MYDERQIHQSRWQIRAGELLWYVAASTTTHRLYAPTGRGGSLELWSSLTRGALPVLLRSLAACIIHDSRQPAPTRPIT